MRIHLTCDCGASIDVEDAPEEWMLATAERFIDSHADECGFAKVIVPDDASALDK